MRSNCVILLCFSFLVLQTNPGGRADVAVRRTDPDAPTATVRSPLQRKIVVHGVDFEPNAATVHPAASPVLNEAVEILGSEVSAVVIVEPPSNDDHSETFRLMQARRRAKAVRQYLIGRGIAASRITIPADAGTVVASAAPLAHRQPVELRVQ